MDRSVKSDRVKESEMHAQNTMSHSDVADTGADNSVTSRMELCIITNLEFTIGKRKRRTTLKLASATGSRMSWESTCLFTKMYGQWQYSGSCYQNSGHHMNVVRRLCYIQYGHSQQLKPWPPAPVSGNP